MNITAGKNIQVHQDARGIMVSRRRKPGATTQAASDANPFAGMGWCASVVAGAVHIEGGNVKVVINSATAGLITELDSEHTGDPFLDNGTMKDFTFTGFTPNMSGVLCFKYGLAANLQTGVGDVQDRAVDFGEGEFNQQAINISYGFTETEEAFGNTVNGSRYAIVYETDLPDNSDAYFYAPICRLTTDADSKPSVQQVHIGDIHVPKGMEALVSEWSMDHND